MSLAITIIASPKIPTTIQQSISSPNIYQVLSCDSFPAASVSALMNQVDDSQRLLQSAQQQLARIERLTQEHLPARLHKVDDKFWKDYVQTFISQKFIPPTIQSLKRRFDSGVEQFNRILAEFTEADSALNTAQKATQGAVHQRSVASLLGNLLVSSEYLESAVVCVPLAQKGEFEKLIPSLPGLVPNSNTIAQSDVGHAAYALVVFKPELLQLKDALAKQKYQLREYQDIEDGDTEILKGARKSALQRFTTFLASTQGEYLSLTLSTYIMRGALESQLRFGKDGKIVIIIDHNSQKQVRNAIKTSFQNAADEDADMYDEIETDNAFLPYVLVTGNIQEIDK
ncbi:Vacuolar ATP synthase subunit C [Spironucleus salmonicida]|uniref:V-type proton ATPase subunit C n=1 Tax=Spironucleus salmonicida TaxID=348837 RepID=V6LCQ3_9EUKA|nr:Vacuolar ATP synthase subunit C [Spironucleus salmonicida]|eukprot:EST41456.1 Vacuolar ATP synthase subunit C [Spironucleus salmonicida]